MIERYVEAVCECVCGFFFFVVVCFTFLSVETAIVDVVSTFWIALEHTHAWSLRW